MVAQKQSQKIVVLSFEQGCWVIGDGTGESGDIMMVTQNQSQKIGGFVRLLTWSLV